MNLDICNNYKSVYCNILNLTQNYLRKNKNVKSMVLGVSGGLDSAVVAALISEVEGVKLIGRSLPIEDEIFVRTKDAKEGNWRADLVGKAFCNDYEVTSLNEEFKSYTENPQLNIYPKQCRIILGNIKARLRMIHLYALAWCRSGIVLSTDNYTEYLLGFWTLHGDVGDLGVIQPLWKAEVYKLANFLMNRYSKDGEYLKAAALDACIKAMPTDGLGITNNDFEQMFPDYPTDTTPAEIYEIIDRVLIFHLTKTGYKDIGHGVNFEMMKPIIDRYKATAFKRENPYNLKRIDLIV